jgi:hypothetical protein
VQTRMLAHQDTCMYHLLWISWCKLSLSCRTGSWMQLIFVLLSKTWNCRWWGYQQWIEAPLQGWATWWDSEACFCQSNQWEWWFHQQQHELLCWLQWKGGLHCTSLMPTLTTSHLRAATSSPLWQAKKVKVLCQSESPLRFHLISRI